jgi:cell wall-associated NlpC family hydrolase
MTPQRQAVIDAARAWVGTPYHHRACLQGVGVDCLMLLLAVYQPAGLLPQGVAVPDYPQDIMLHRDDPAYLNGVLDHCEEVETPQPGDIALWKFGRCFSHGGIVVDWPTIIHAYKPFGSVVEMSTTDDSRMRDHAVRFFAPRGYAE